MTEACNVISCNLQSATTFQAVLTQERHELTCYCSLLLCRRHVLRFLLQSPHGFHVEMASQTPFVYGDEDTVMACLTKV